ncbi:MAG: HAMP domain-containing sensor histidine kinase [Methylococcales bacterium]|nr:HAMP domain-containing sensor histidine kinase [Methylococcales bacterium]
MAELQQTETIYPCPFSKGYGIPNQQAWLLLKVFLLYRVVLSSLLVILFYSHFSHTLIVTKYSTLYNYSSKLYLFLSVISIFFAFWRIITYSIQTQIIIFVDIIAITLVMHSCGGISSGFGILLAGSLAASGLLIGGRCSMVFSAIATVSIFTEQAYAIRLNEVPNSTYPTVGMLGATFFITAFLAYILAKRSEQSELLANKQQQTIVSLEALNQYIIQHLQSGVIIVNKHQQVITINEAASSLLFQCQTPLKLDDISTPLSLLFKNWIETKNQDFFTLQRSKQASLHLRFDALKTGEKNFYMIMLEDISLHNQRLQQGVLASLGQLTANIAHEIRNPLSAITHATQLLSENTELNPQDIRLTEIILNHSGRVNKIINDILQSSKRTPRNRKNIELNEYLKKYLDDFILEQNINTDFLQLSLYDRQLSARIDSEHLKQIMDNLCQNALKYGHPEKGTIIIKLSELTGSPCIDIIDNGTLFNSEVISHLFKPFFTTSKSGTGLGLYISRELAELNQASLDYRINSKKKNSFRLQLSNSDNIKIEL